MTNGANSTKKRSSWWLLLLLIPFIATLIPNFYNSATPELGGIPFFYWYQILWIILTGIIMGIVYALKVY